MRRAWWGLLAGGALALGACGFSALDGLTGGDVPDGGNEGGGGSETGAPTDGGGGGGQDVEAPVPVGEGGTCPPNSRACGGVCASASDPSFGCGAASCDPCPSPVHGTTICKPGGGCGVVCAGNYLDCNSDAADGCEVDGDGDHDHCGSCTIKCTVDQVCSKGGCSSTCITGQTNCGGSCFDLNKNPYHCGDCGKPCPTFPNATATCDMGQCTGGYTCNGTYADCDKDAGDGCESLPPTDAKNCGTCGNDCTTTPGAVQSCFGGKCMCQTYISDCNGDLGVPGGDGCECDTTNRAHYCSATKKCETCGEAGFACTSQNQCCPGYSCQDGVKCCADLGTTCASFTGCCSGNCDADTHVCVP